MSPTSFYCLSATFQLAIKMVVFIFRQDSIHQYNSWINTQNDDIPTMLISTTVNEPHTDS